FSSAQRAAAKMQSTRICFIEFRSIYQYEAASECDEGACQGADKRVRWSAIRVRHTVVCKPSLNGHGCVQRHLLTRLVVFDGNFSVLKPHIVNLAHSLGRPRPEH